MASGGPSLEGKRSRPHRHGTLGTRIRRSMSLTQLAAQTAAVRTATGPPHSGPVADSVPPPPGLGLSETPLRAASATLLGAFGTFPERVRNDALSEMVNLWQDLCQCMGAGSRDRPGELETDFGWQM